MKTDFDNWYKDKFKEFNSEPPDTVWEGISEELDFDAVWSGINQSLDKSDKRKKVAMVFFATVAILLTGLAIFTLNNQSSEMDVAKNRASIKLFEHNDSVVSNQLSYVKAKAVLSEEQQNTSTHSTVDAVIKSNRVNVSDNQAPPVSALNSLKKNNAPKRSTIQYSSTIQNDLNDDSKENFTPLMQKFNMLLFNITNSNAKIDSSIIYNIHLLPSLVAGSTTEKKYISIGISSASLNSWQLNGDTYNGLKKNTLNQTLISFGRSYGIFLGCDLSNKFSAQSEWVINDVHSQNYIEYIEGRQINKTISLNYTQFSCLFRKKNPQLIVGGKIPASWNYIAGVQYGYLKNVNQILDGEKYSIKGDYKKTNYTLVLGLEYQVFIKKYWVVSAGLRGNMGLKNIYSGNASQVPAKLYNTYISSASINVGLAYRLPLK